MSRHIPPTSPHSSPSYSFIAVGRAARRTRPEVITRLCRLRRRPASALWAVYVEAELLKRPFERLVGRRRERQLQLRRVSPAVRHRRRGDDGGLVRKERKDPRGECLCTVWPRQLPAG